MKLEKSENKEQRPGRFFLVSYMAISKITGTPINTSVVIATPGGYVNNQTFLKMVVSQGKYINPTIMGITELSERDASDFTYQNL